MKYIDADLLRKELESRITDNTFGAKLELIDILAWLDTLESEKPINQEGLEEEIDRYLEPLLPVDIQEEPFTQMDKCARHFAQWGAEHAREQMMKEAVEGEIRDFRFIREINFALTWEDIKEIQRLLDVVWSEQDIIAPIDEDTIYIEVLNRFNKSKEGKK